MKMTHTRALYRASIVTVVVCLGPHDALAQTRPKLIENGRIAILDDLESGLDAWTLEGAAKGGVRIVTDELSGRPALEWTLGDVDGKLVYRHMDRLTNFGRYSRIRIRLRAWDDEGRLGVGCAARGSFRVLGYPKHKVDRTPSWGLYDRNSVPSKDWRFIDEYLDFPTWYPWGEQDNTKPGFYIGMAAGFSKHATVRIDEIALIDDFVEVHGDWGRMTREKNGSARWDYEVQVINRTDSPQTVAAAIVEPKLRKFTGQLLNAAATIEPRKTGSLRVRVAMPKDVIESVPPLYHEDLRVRVTPEALPTISTTVRLPATVPLQIRQRPCLLETAEEWREKRKEFATLSDKDRARKLREADAWLETEIVLPPSYHVNREVVLVDGTKEVLPRVVGWSSRCPKCKTGLRNFPTATTAVCRKCEWKGTDHEFARWFWHKKYFKGVETLGAAYQLTLDRRYAEKAAEILKAYAANLDKYPLRGITVAKEKGWARFALNNLHEGWLIMPLCYGYDMVHDVPGLFSPAERAALHQDFLIPLARSEMPITSWFSNQTSVRYMAAALCGINAGDSNLVHFAVFGHAGLQRAIGASINPDGFMTEIPINYHWANLIEMLRLAIVLRNTGIDAPYRRDLLEKACRVPFLRAFPNGHVTGFGPHGGGRGPGYYPQHYGTVAKLFDDPIFQEVADRKAGRELIANLDSVHFPDTELIVLRQGKGEKQHAVNFLFGNKRRCHDAAMAFTWYGHGQLLAPAVGSLYNITSPPGAWISPFYCQVNVDDLHQVNSTGKLTFHEFGPGAQIASAEASKLFPGVKVERTLALHDGLLFVADRFVSREDHACQWAYLSEGALNVSGSFREKQLPYTRDKLRLKGMSTDAPWQAEWTRKDLKLRLTMLGSPQTDVFWGDSYISPGRPAEKCPLVLARRKTKATIFLGVLEPYDGEPRIKRVEREKLDAPETEAAAIRVTVGGGTHVFVVNYRGQPIRGRDWECEKRAAVITR